VIDPPLLAVEAPALKATVAPSGTALDEDVKLAVGGASMVTVWVLVSVWPLLVIVSVTVWVPRLA
jgi:hypothetical protein